jgi:hypothetical protein
VIGMERSPARTLLEHLVRQSRQTIEENCNAFERTAAGMSERATLSARQLSRWMAGEVDSARPVMQRVAEQHWGHSFVALLRPVLAEDPRPVVSPAGVGAAFVPDALEAAALMAAQESSQHAASVGGGINPTSIEQIQADVLRLARRYREVAPIRLLAEARHVRDRAYMLLARTQRPTQTADLYLAAGQACGLMAISSFDLAIWDAAEDQARAAYTYAELVDHPGLRAWLRGTQALIAYWSGHPHRALNLALAGIAEAPDGPAAARLRGIEARAWAHLGNAGAVTDALAHADRAMDNATGTDDLLDGVGGEFGWGPSAHCACAGTALLGVGDADGAATRIRTALRVLPDDPYASLAPERAHVDIAAAELIAGRFDAAVNALDHVWAIPIAHRRHSITGRLDGIARALSTPRWTTERAAGDLRDRIEAFTTEATRQRALTEA